MGPRLIAWVLTARREYKTKKEASMKSVAGRVVFTPKAEVLGLQVKLQLRSEFSLGTGSVATAVDRRL